MSATRTAAVFLFITHSSEAFQSMRQGLDLRRQNFPATAFTNKLQHTPLYMAKKKSRGFAKSEPTSSSGISNEINSSDTITTADEQPTTTTMTSEPNAGLTALERMRAEQRRQKEDELRRVKELRSVDEYVREDPTAAVIPEKVAMRMGKRMLPFVGVPLFGVMGTFVAFWYLRVYKNLEFSTVAVAVATIGLLVVGLLGITYSVMSASWDEDVEGSTLGLEEVSKNLDSIKDGLRRSKENVLLRERMAGMPEAEIQAAIRELDKKDEREKMMTMTYEEKLNKEMK